MLNCNAPNEYLSLTHQSRLNTRKNASHNSNFQVTQNFIPALHAHAAGFKLIAQFFMHVYCSGFI